jgi:ribose transport system permease protein
MTTLRSASKYLGLDRISGIYLWALFLIVFGVWRPGQFLTPITVHSVASAQAVAGIVAIAVLIPLVCGHYDLSVGANANLAGIIAVVIQLKWNWPVPAAIFFSVIVAAAVGVVNGIFVVRFHINSFIVTLGMASILSAIQIIVTAQQQPDPVTTPSWNTFSQYSIGGFQIVVLYLIVLGAAAYWFLDHTPTGRFMRAVGANPDAARLSGVRVDRLSFISLVMSGTIAGLGGVLYTSLTGPSLSFGSTLLLPAFAAAFLGSTQLQPGRFNVWGTLLAIYVLATGVVGMQLVSGQQWLSDMFDGVALILAVALAVSRQRRVVNRPGGATEETNEADLGAYDAEPATGLQEQAAVVQVAAADRERDDHT